MSTSSGEETSQPAVVCPVCGEAMRREVNGFRSPPMPGAFWFCTSVDCDDGRQNRIYSGG